MSSISGVSGATYNAMSTSLANEATARKSLEVQDQIAISVINQVQDQQEMMAEALVKMMETGQVDLYV